MLRNSLLGNKRTKTYSKTGEKMIDLYSQTFVFPKEYEYTVVEVSEDTEARPDIISIALYNTDMYGDLLCKINGISNPIELSVGTLIVAPEVSCIGDFYTKETTDLDAVDSKSKEGYMPVPKMKKEKRKANEAVVGDVRYKIDSANRIIIY